jgi:hypothetical protein
MKGRDRMRRYEIYVKIHTDSGVQDGYLYMYGTNLHALMKKAQSLIPYPIEYRSHCMWNAPDKNEYTDKVLLLYFTGDKIADRKRHLDVFPNCNSNVSPLWNVT